MYHKQDFNCDGKVDAAEEMIADEMLCTSREEHIALFGDAGEWGKEEDNDSGGWAIDDGNWSE